MQQQNNAPQETPKALKDRDGSLVLKRGYDDLVESLYDELQEKDPGLKALEVRLKALHESKDDSTNAFNAFDNKNQRYYNAANTHVERLSDSLLKTKMRLLIAASLKNYDTAVSPHRSLLKTIAAQEINLADMHTVLKLTKTLSVIEDFQKNNLSTAQPLQGYKQEQSNVLKLADTLLKK